MVGGRIKWREDEDDFMLRCVARFGRAWSKIEDEGKRTGRLTRPQMNIKSRFVTLRKQWGKDEPSYLKHLRDRYGFE